MDIRRLDLNLLLLLDDLLITKNLTATAGRLGMSQPSASSGLSKLRHFFKDDLFVRTGRGLRPTPFAEDLERPVHLVIEKITGDILRVPGFDPTSSDRTFTVTMPDLGEVIFIPPILQEIDRVAPRVSLKCLNIPYAEVHTALEEGVVDLAIGYFPDLSEVTINSQLLFEDRFVCIVRNGHQKYTEGMPLKDFLELEHLSVEQPARAGIFENWTSQHGPKRKTRLTIPHLMSVPRLVSVTELISVVPVSLANTFAQQYDLRIFEPPIAMPAITVRQFWHRRMNNEPAITWLRGIVAAQLTAGLPRSATSDSNIATINN